MVDCGPLAILFALGFTSCVGDVSSVGRSSRCRSARAVFFLHCAVVPRIHLLRLFDGDTPTCRPLVRLVELREPLVEGQV